jgi:hypothetical protein
MRRSANVARLLSLLVLALTKQARADPPETMVQVTASFQVGAYTSLNVDPRHPDHVAIGTADGHVLLSTDGGKSSRVSRAATPRAYAIQPLRGLYERRRELSGADLYDRYHDTRYFYWQIDQGLTPGRWQSWMSTDDRTAEIADVAFSGDDSGRVIAAGAAGVMVADLRTLAFSRAIGSPRPKGDLLTGLSATVDPLDPRHLLAGTSQGLMQSWDGGATFAATENHELADARVTRLVWSAEEPALLWAVTAGAVFESSDRGGHFAERYKSADTINVAAPAKDGLWIGTGGGLTFLAADGATDARLPGEVVLGVVSIGPRRALVATDRTLFRVDPGGERVLMRTTDADPFLRLGGDARTAWLLSRYAIFRTDQRPARAPDPAVEAPALRLGFDEVQNAVVRHMRLGRPQDTRLADRWYAKLLPKITVRVKGVIGRSGSLVYNALFPIRYYTADATSSWQCCGGNLGEASPAATIVVTWDLAKIFAGVGNASYPLSWIEQILRPIKGQILEQVRWRYRESAALVALLQRPPRDPLLQLAWQLRLEEHASYLEALAGRQVVSLKRWEEP